MVYIEEQGAFLPDECARQRLGKKDAELGYLNARIVGNETILFNGTILPHTHYSISNDGHLWEMANKMYQFPIKRIVFNNKPKNK